jgi:AhpC/TSA family
MAVLAPGTGLGGLIGEPAPPLVVKEWIKGQPVAVKAGTNIYVVEFWGTSNLGSRACITNFNNLQKRFKTNGVVIVGISGQPVEKIKEFVLHDGGTNIAYGIAADDQRQTALSYMVPAKQQGIPYAFVVGTNGNVLWHGHPLGGLNKALEQITAGQYDVERARKAEIAENQMEQYLGLARRGDFRSKSAGATLLANRTNDVTLLCDMAYQISTAPHLASRDIALAGEALDQAEKLSVTNKAPVMIIRAVWLFASGKQDAGMILATQAINSAQSPMDKNRIQLLLRTMEAHLAATKTNQGNTNQINAAHSSDQVPVANTNQSKGPAGKP